MTWGLLKRIRLLGAMVATLSLAAAGSAQAVVTTNGCGGSTSCTMAELFANGSISIGNVTFDNWSLNTGDTEFTPANATVSGFDPVPLSDPGQSVLSLRVTFNPALVPDPSLLVAFTFDVSVAGSGVLTQGALSLTSFSSTQGTSIIVASDIVGPGVTLGVGFPLSSVPGTTFAPLPDVTSFTQDTEIQAEASSIGSPGLIAFDYSYILAAPPANLPEPASVLLLGLGLAGLGLAGRGAWRQRPTA